MQPQKFQRCLRFLAVCAITAFTAQAFASDEPRRAVPPLPKYQQECGACHTVYPAGMLPSGSWQRLMSDLKRHFGTDASLDAATQKEITNWLVDHAGTYKRVNGEPPQDRITLSPWFVRKHHEVQAADWKLPGVKSASNCGACHSGASQGDFSERRVKIPR